MLQLLGIASGILTLGEPSSLRGRVRGRERIGN